LATLPIWRCSACHGGPQYAPGITTSEGIVAAMTNKAARPHIVVATPCYGGNVTNYYALSAIKLKAACIERGVELSFRMLGGDALITRARSNLAAEFLDEPDATHLLFIDADIGFRPEQVFALLDGNRDVVSGVYPMKIVNWDRIEAQTGTGRPLVPAATMSYAVEFLDPAAITPVDGLAQVRYVGTGFMLIRRAVFTRMAEHYPALKFRGFGRPTLEDRERFGFFESMIDPETGSYLSEDYAFCKRWRDIGGEIWIHLDSRLTHVGNIAFDGDLMSLFG
jgi:hypothetical protein